MSRCPSRLAYAEWSICLIILSVPWRPHQKRCRSRAHRRANAMSLVARRLFSRWFARPLILAIALLLTLFAASGFLGVRFWHARQSASLAVEHSRQVLDTLDRLRANVADLEAERRGYLLTLDPA